MDEASSAIPDGPDWREDGTVVFYVDGEEWNALRRPKLGELRQLRESMEEISDEALRLTAKAAIDRPPRPEADADAQVKVDYTIAARDNQRHLNAAIDELYADWVRQTFDMLGAKALAAEPEWPLWLAHPQFPPTLIQHMQTVPLVRGGS